MPRKRQDIIGKKFGRLTAIEYLDKYDSYGHIYVKCRCDCGNIVERPQMKLIRKGKVEQSCGCATIKHGGWHNKEKLYAVWYSFRNRCTCPTATGYSNYGGRGISYAPEWNDYSVFREWAYKNGYSEDCNLDIDRIDVNGNYDPSNCRFITRRQNCRNTRRNLYLNYNGEKKCLAEVIEITGRSKTWVKKNYEIWNEAS